MSRGEPTTAAAALRANEDESTDIFPKYTSTVFEKLRYPSSFALLANDPRFKPFIAYIRNHLMYYKREPNADRYQRHLQDFDKTAKGAVTRFRPAEMNWLKVHRRYSAKLNESFKANVDVRAGFKIGNRYLVKAFFTFGQRTVKPDSVHVYQILDVPLVLYVARSSKCSIGDRLFPVDDYHRYELLIMPPNGTYHIPPGTTYFVMALQKTFFSLDVFSSSSSTLQQNVPSINPLEAKVRRLTGMYEHPPAEHTPFIDDLDRDDEEEERRATVVQNVATLQCPRNKTQHAVQHQQTEPQQHVVQLQQFYSTEPRKTQYIHTPDFVKEYQALAKPEYGDPRLFYVFENNDDQAMMMEEEQTVPMDLSSVCCPESPDFYDFEQLITFDDDNQEEVSRLQDELIAASPFFM